MILVIALVLLMPVIYVGFWIWLTIDNIRVYGWLPVLACAPFVVAAHVVGALLFAPYV